MNRPWLPALALLGLLAAGCGTDADRPSEPAAPERTIPFQKDGTLTFLRTSGEEIVTIDIELAEGDSARARGLMDRTSLPERSGMFFPMPGVDRHSFWMANTPLSLDITFVGPDSTIVNTAKYTRPYSQESVVAEGPAQWVVETPAGFTDTWGITEGDRIRWSLDRDGAAVR